MFCSQLVVVALQRATAGDPRFARLARVRAHLATPAHVATLAQAPVALRAGAPPAPLLRPPRGARRSAASARECR